MKKIKDKLPTESTRIGFLAVFQPLLDHFLGKPDILQEVQGLVKPTQTKKHLEKVACWKDYELLKEADFKASNCKVTFLLSNI